MHGDEQVLEFLGHRLTSVNELDVMHHQSRQIRG